MEGGNILLKKYARNIPSVDNFAQVRDYPDVPADPDVPERVLDPRPRLLRPAAAGRVPPGRGVPAGRGRVRAHVDPVTCLPRHPRGHRRARPHLPHDRLERAHCPDRQVTTEYLK